MKLTLQGALELGCPSELSQLETGAAFVPLHQPVTGQGQAEAWPGRLPAAEGSS